MRGRGGAGARGYLLIPRDKVGDVGDLRVAAVRAVEPSLFEESFFLGFMCCFFGFRLFWESSLCNLMRIDRLEGEASSVEVDTLDFERV